jgi:hypothetical protein
MVAVAEATLHSIAFDMVAAMNADESISDSPTTAAAAAAVHRGDVDAAGRLTAPYNALGSGDYYPTGGSADDWFYYVRIAAGVFNWRFFTFPFACFNVRS